MYALYQLTTRTEQLKGSFFFVDGPHDTYGYVLKSTQKESGDWLNLVRGTGHGEQGRHHANNCTPANLM